MSDIEGARDDDRARAAEPDERRPPDDPAGDAKGTPAEGVVNPDEPDPVEPSEPG